MRKLVILRGTPGVGKSTFARAFGLEANVLSPDSVRMMLGGAIMSANGKMTLDQTMNIRTHAMVRDIGRERMARGETLVLDMTFAAVADVQPWLDLARELRYQVAVVDWSDFPVGLAVDQDARRPEFKRVGEYAIRAMHAQIKANPIPADADVEIINFIAVDDHFAALNEWLSEPIMNFDRYERVVHIGDLQGCYTVLAEGPLRDGLRDDTAYVFVGDLLDRGIENGEVMSWFVREALPRPNVFLLWGNHEDHLDLWARGKEPVSPEFRDRTLPQLQAAGIRPSHAEAVCAKAREFLRYSFLGTKVFVSHAGLSAVPARPELISLRQYSHGTGFWEDPVDQQFERNTPAESDWVQIHGHRNHGNVPVLATPRSFNLEDSVEAGGNLRTVTLDADGWTAREYRNPVFRSARDRMALEVKITQQRVKARRACPPWMFGPARPLVIDQATLEVMRGHKGVRERASESFPHVASLNFTKKVFYDASWDDVVVKARGLFFDTGTAEIVSRGYEKFFNVGERPETSLDALSRDLAFPLTVYVKSNGFLGNAGYDRRTDSLFTASKSTPDGVFADIFRDILGDTLDDAAQDRLRRYLRDMEASMTFEVIDPVRDPHMIEYDRPKLVLLDILRRSIDFEKAPYEVLTEVGQRFGLEVKERAMVFKDWKSFEGWHRRATANLAFKHAGANVEGFVIEDAKGFMTKIKLPYYAFWKQMRGMKDRMLAARERGTGFDYRHDRRPGGGAPTEQEVALAHAFRDWCLDQEDDILKADIITLRRGFEEAALRPEVGMAMA